MSFVDEVLSFIVIYGIIPWGVLLAAICWQLFNSNTRDSNKTGGSNGIPPKQK